MREVRSASIADVPMLVEMGRLFHDGSPYAALGPFDPVAVELFLRHMLALPNAVVLTHGDGAIGGIIVQLPFSPSVTVMEEAFWWARRDGRLLLAALEAEATKRGAKAMILSTMAERPGMAGMVQRRGYAPAERKYLKAL